MATSRRRTDLRIVFQAQDITKQIKDVSLEVQRYGGLADIYHGFWTGDRGRIKVAIKFIRAVDQEVENIMRRHKREVKIWHGLHHPCILPLLGLYWGTRRLPAMVSIWCLHTNIRSYLRTLPDGDPGVPRRRRLLLQIALGLEYLHGHPKPIVHGDLKGDNILVSDDGLPKICDFGLSKITAETTNTVTRVRGTMRWMAPELLHDKAFVSTESDVWAYACVMIEIFTGSHPYATKATDTAVWIALTTLNEMPSGPDNVPDVCWDLACKCFDFSPPNRPTATAIVQDPVFASDVAHALEGDFHLSEIATSLPSGSPSVAAVETDTLPLASTLRLTASAATDIEPSEIRRSHSGVDSSRGVLLERVSRTGGSAESDTDDHSSSEFESRSASPERKTVPSATVNLPHLALKDGATELSLPREDLVEIPDQGSGSQGVKATDGSPQIEPSHAVLVIEDRQPPNNEDVTSDVLTEMEHDSTDTATVRTTPRLTPQDVREHDSAPAASLASPGMSPTSLPEADGHVETVEKPVLARVRSPWTSAPRDPEKFSLEEGEKVEVLDVEGLWCRVKKADGTEGNILYGHISGKARALYSYTASEDDEISFEQGAVFDVLDSSAEWWSVELHDGSRGIVPSNYVCLI